MAVYVVSQTGLTDKLFNIQSESGGILPDSTYTRNILSVSLHSLKSNVHIRLKANKHGGGTVTILGETHNQPSDNSMI